jgi:hypothetical protein
VIGLDLALGGVDVDGHHLAIADRWNTDVGGDAVGAGATQCGVATGGDVELAWMIGVTDDDLGAAVGGLFAVDQTTGALGRRFGTRSRSGRRLRQRSYRG